MFYYSCVDVYQKQLSMICTKNSKNASIKNLNGPLLITHNYLQHAVYKNPPLWCWGGISRENQGTVSI